MQFAIGLFLGMCFAWFLQGFKCGKELSKKHNFNEWGSCEKCGKEVQDFNTPREALDDNCK